MVVLPVGVVRYCAWGHCIAAVVVDKWRRGAGGFHGIRLPHAHLWDIGNALAGEARVTTLRFAGVSAPFRNVLKVSKLMLSPGPHLWMLGISLKLMALML